jgi:hypothetical protein
MILVVALCGAQVYFIIKLFAKGRTTTNPFASKDF